MSGNDWNRLSGSYMVIWGSHQTLWSIPLPPVTWHSGIWPYTVTPSIDQKFRLIVVLLPNWKLYRRWPYYRIPGGFHRTFATGAASQQRMLTPPGHVPFWTCICSYVEIILSWTCHVSGLHISDITRCMYFASFKQSNLTIFVWNTSIGVPCKQKKITLP